MTTLRGKTIAITGAASGIGRALAKELSERGADVAISDVDERGLAETAETIRTKVSKKLVDVADRDAVHTWADEVVEEHGRVDGIVNNAGVSVSVRFENMSYEDLDWILGINLYGVIHGTKAFLPHLLSRGQGWVVNVSSVFGIVSYKTQAAYNISKFGVRGLTEALAQELEETGVSVLSVHPGGIRTNIVRNARYHEDAAGIGDHDKVAEEFARNARTTPQMAATQIADAMEARARKLLIGNDAKVVDAVQRLFPESYPKVLETLVNATRK